MSGVVAGLAIGCGYGALADLILLPVQVWLWFVIHSVTSLPAVAAPSAASLGVAAQLGRRLHPGAGSRTA